MEPPKSLKEFTLLRRLGDGSYSEVYHARHDATGNEYALKVINKQHILRHKVVYQIRREKDILSRLSYAGIVQLHFTFQDSDSLYLALDYCHNGELYDQIRRLRTLDIDTARFYAAEIVLMLQVLCENGIMHRDLKPENLLLTATGHLKLIDFGTAKDLKQPDLGREGDEKRPPSNEVEESGNDDEPVRTSSFVGTADYVCPELLDNSAPIGYAADYWALGCVLYQMLSGRPPFKAATEYLTFQKISSGEYAPLDAERVPEDARDLVARLLEKDPEKRIGSRDIEELKNHAFFSSIVWDQLLESPAPEAVQGGQHGGSEGSSDDEDAFGGGYDWELQSLKAQKYGLRC